MTEKQLVEIFKEWKLRVDLAPEAFLSYEEVSQEPLQAYGEMAAKFFLYLVDELAGYQVK